MFNSTLTATTHGGGIVGANDHALIKNCVFTGKITGLTAIGGIAGYSEFANITDCYVNAVIEADSWAGGILGMQAGADDGTNGVKRCIAKGEVKGGSGMGFGRHLRHSLSGNSRQLAQRN